MKLTRNCKYCSYYDDLRILRIAISNLLALKSDHKYVIITNYENTNCWNKSSSWIKFLFIKSGVAIRPRFSVKQRPHFEMFN